MTVEQALHNMIVASRKLSVTADEHDILEKSRKLLIEAVEELKKLRAQAEVGA